MAEALDFQPDTQDQALDFQPDSQGLDFQPDAPDPAQMSDLERQVIGLPPKQQHPSTLLTTAARIAPALLGAGIGSFVPVVGTAAGGAIGAGLGEGLAQYLEGDFKPAQIPLAVGLGLIPAARFPGVTSLLGRTALRAGEGALMGAGGTVASRAVEGELPTGQDLLQSALMGGALGGGFGAIEHALTPRAPKVMPEAPKPMTQGELFAGPELATTSNQTLEKIAQLEAQNKQLAKDAQFAGQKPGTQRQLFEDDPLFDTTPPNPSLKPDQIRQMYKLMRTSPEKAVAYLNSIVPQAKEVTPVRTVETGAKLLGMPINRGRLAETLGIRSSDATLPDKPTDIGLFMKKLGMESSRMVEGFGAAGQKLVQDVRTVYNGFESELSQFLDGPQGVGHLANEMKLTPSERENITDVMQGIAVPKSQNVEQITNIMKVQRDAIAKRVMQSGSFEIRDPVSGETVPWQPRPDYFPHFLDFDAVVKDKARLARAVQDIQVQAQVTEPEAQQIFNQMRMNSRREYGHLEVARHFNFSDYERDGIKAWSQYVEGALKRLNEAAVFGKKGENAAALVQHIGLTAGDDAAQAAQKYITNVTGHDPVTGIKTNDPNASRILTALRSFQVGAKLGQAVIANASQSNMTALITGYGNLAKGFQELQTQGGKDFARLAGATIEQTMRDLNEALGVGKFGSTVLKYTGFSKVEQFNRMLAANSGKVFAHDLVAKLKDGATGRAADTYRRHLRALGIEPMDVIKQGFTLTQDQELSAARSVIARSQFKVRPQELPLYWHGPLGKFVTQFSSFAFKAGKAINDEVVREARQGNYKPLARFLLVTPLVGEVFADAQALVKGGKDRPDNIVARVADNYASIGALGLAWDAFRSTGYGEVGVLRRMVGPNLSDLAQIAYGLRNPKQLGRVAVQNIPVIGPALRPTLFPPKKQKKED